MALSTYIRFRQVCLATLEFEKNTELLSHILGTGPCHRSKLEQFGLENALFALGGSFIEIVAPTQEKTAVHRFMKASNGLGGYMAIFDCDDVDRFRINAKNAQINTIVDERRPNADLLQLNPKNTGITLLEFDCHHEGKNRLGAYEWAGPNWQENMVRDIDIFEISMSCANPLTKTKDWCQIFGQPLNDENCSIYLDHGTINFEENERATRDYFRSITLKSEDKDEYLTRAQECGLKVRKNIFEFCGIEWIWA